MIAERDLVFSKDIGPDLERDRKANARAYDQIQARLSDLKGAGKMTEIDAARGELRKLAEEREQIIERVKKASPRLSALQYPEPLKLAAVRAALDEGTVLLSYSVNDESTLLFAVAPSSAETGLSVFKIPASREDLEASIGRFNELIRQRHNARHAVFARQARDLYDILLKPAEASINAARRLLVVCDGFLHSLPFAALMRNDKQFLIEWKPVHTAVSATVYAELKRRRRDQAGAPLRLAAFGDPQYPAVTAAVRKGSDSDLRRSIDRGLTFSRLAFSREEVKAIGALFPQQNRIYLGNEATEERAKSLGKDIRYIHFAVHGLLDNEVPLNSAIALTIPEHLEEGRENGLLQAWEIFEQVRIDADLVGGSRW
jgi:CHAT domain-containing protein